MTPAPETRVVARARLAALRAAGGATLLDDNLHLAGRDVKPHVRDVPLGGDSEDLGEEVAVAHPRTVGRYGRARNQSTDANLPTRVPEDPAL